MTYKEILQKSQKNNIHVTLSESEKLASLVVEYDSLRTQEKEIKTEKDQIGKQIKSHAQRTTDGQIVVAGFKVTLTEKTSRGFDYEEAEKSLSKAEYEKYVLPFLKMSTSSSLSVTEIKE